MYQKHGFLRSLARPYSPHAHFGLGDQAAIASTSTTVGPFSVDTYNADASWMALPERVAN